MKCCAIITAGGIGKRIAADIPKQFIPIKNIPIIIRTLQTFQQIENIDNIIISVHSEWYSYTKNLIKEYNISKVAEIVMGGLERQDSVFNAINTKIAKSSDIVLVHDAVRPFIKKDLINKVIEAAEESGAAIPVVRPKDTVKEVSPHGLVVKTLNRTNLRIVQTPQAYWYDILHQAYSEAAKVNYRGTDSASLVEFIRYKIAIVDGDDLNIKITTPFDLKIGELIVEEES